MIKNANLVLIEFNYLGIYRYLGIHFTEIRIVIKFIFFLLINKFYITIRYTVEGKTSNFPFFLPRDNRIIIITIAGIINLSLIT